MSRYYDPVTHRFVNADGYFQSGGDILSANMSAYCANNPVIRTDPSGEFWIIAAAVTFVCIGTAVVLSSCSSSASNNSKSATRKATSNIPQTSTPKSNPPQKPSSSPKKASKNLVGFIKEYEVFYDHVYDDGYGNMTIGYGHVISANDNFTEITEVEATALLLEDLSIHEDSVNNYSLSLGVEWDQQQFDAFVDLSFNSGSGMNMAMDDIIGGMDPYTAFTRDEKELGLYRRRNDEANIYLYGKYQRTYPNW